MPARRTLRRLFHRLTALSRSRHRIHADKKSGRICRVLVISGVRSGDMRACATLCFIHLIIKKCNRSFLRDCGRSGVVRCGGEVIEERVPVFKNILMCVTHSGTTIIFAPFILRSLSACGQSEVTKTKLFGVRSHPYVQQIPA